MGHLVELSRQILHHAQALESQLEAAAAPQPSLTSGGPALYPTPSTHPQIFTTRSTLVDASKEMCQLALGPGDALRSMIGSEKIELFTLNAIDRLGVCKHVPPFPSSISVKKLAQGISVQPEILERLLRFAGSMNLFNVVNEQVSHTALSEAQSWQQSISQIFSVFSS
ncbi:hypothetical protein K458DRAFT_434733 [Lentithecium fluviatile CBS 122367]|uniref:Uncharacterized protein n=1 Tax=Lentithecium fluviatile CBS 122367 TaxID=1168545 RepID=A0A6G1INN8_9PLEO|nr:hypothetical protein K458DRAFT_434733 [Lentithecium fluviatile CBS 122367]